MLESIAQNATIRTAPVRHVEPVQGERLSEIPEDEADRPQKRPERRRRILRHHPDAGVIDDHLDQESQEKSGDDLEQNGPEHQAFVAVCRW